MIIGLPINDEWSVDTSMDRVKVDMTSHQMSSDGLASTLKNNHGPLGRDAPSAVLN